MNRLSAYITGMKLTRQWLIEAQIANEKGKTQQALNHLIAAFEAFIPATNCVISIKDGKRPRKVRP